MDIVHNEVIHLTKGYMIVKCRGQKEIMERVSLTEATEREKAFFKEHLHLRLVLWVEVCFKSGTQRANN